MVKSGNTLQPARYCAKPTLWIKPEAKSIWIHDSKGCVVKAPLWCPGGDYFPGDLVELQQVTRPAQLCQAHYTWQAQQY